jgi:biopolymer transport protein ExbD
MLALDLTPMIDVVFQLIIFFMFTSHFGQMMRTEIDLPREKGDEREIQQQPAMIIDIQTDGTYFVESRETSLNEIERLARNGIAESKSGGPAFDVLIRPDQTAPASDLDRVLTRLSAIGVVDWKIGTIAPDGGLP